MIAWLEGTLRDKAPTRAVVDVKGVGYEALISLTTYAVLPDEGKTIALHIHTHVREEAIHLFGFATTRERDAFELLLRASRVGPKLAQTVLSGMDTERLLTAIRDGDVTGLCKIPGVGRKLAERVIVELRERAEEMLQCGPATPGGASSSSELRSDDEALSALLNLGYPRNKAERVIDAARAEAGEEASTELLIRSALRSLAN